MGRQSSDIRTWTALAISAALFAACAGVRDDPASLSPRPTAAEPAPPATPTAPPEPSLDERGATTCSLDLGEANPRPVPFGQLFPALAPVFEDINPDTASNFPARPDTSSGGRVNGMAGVAGDDQTYYVASEWGGLYKSVDGGDTWDHLPGHIPQTTWDVAVDPEFSQTVYATSFSDGRADPIAGIQVSRDGGATWVHPPDARPNPLALEGTEFDTTPDAGFSCPGSRRAELSAMGIGIRPDDSRHVYIGTRCGVAISHDRGNTWEFRDPTKTTVASEVWDVVVQGGGLHGIVDVCGADGHRRSIDGGRTWSDGGTGLPANTRYCSIAVSPHEPDVLYVTARPDPSGWPWWIYESTDGGATWVSLGSPHNGLKGRIPFVETNERGPTNYDLWSGDGSLFRQFCTSGTPGDPTPRCSPGDYGFCQGTCNGNPSLSCTFDTDCPMAAGPCNNGRSVPCTAGVAASSAATTGPLIPDPACGPRLCNVNVSRAPFTPRFPWVGPYTEGLDGEGVAHAHADAGALEFDSTAATNACPVLFSSDGGVYVNTDDTTDCHDPDWMQPTRSPHALWLWGMHGVDRPGVETENLYFGVQDNGLFATNLAGAADPGATVINPLGADVFDIVADADRVVFIDNSALKYGSTGLIVPTTSLIDGNAPPGSVSQFRYSESIATFGPGQYAIVTTGAGGGAYRTGNITATPVVWSALGTGAPAGGFCSIQVARDGSTPVFFATASPNFSCGGDQYTGWFTLWKLVGLGGAWTRIDQNTGSSTAGFGVVAVDPNDPDRIYGVYNPSGCWSIKSTTTGGDTPGSWQDDARLTYLMQGGGAFLYVPQSEPFDFGQFAALPPPTLLAFDPEDPNVIVAGGRNSGVFITQNGGGRWDLLTDPYDPGGSGIPHLPSPRFAYFDHEPPGDETFRVFVGTQGRGVWRITLTSCTVAGVDNDGDGWGDFCDNCPGTANFDQADTDGDGHGNACDLCLGVPDDQADTDGDCPGEAYSGGPDCGDACDVCTDTDGDSTADEDLPQNLCPTDNCPVNPNHGQLNSDADSLGDACDNCPTVTNEDQTDTDDDQVGDACDPCTDTDGDGFGDPGFPASTCALDNCPDVANPDQSDPDGDGLGLLCDRCPTVATDDNTDSDGDGLGDRCDPFIGCATGCAGGGGPICLDCVLGGPSLLGDPPDHGGCSSFGGTPFCISLFPKPKSPGFCPPFLAAVDACCIGGGNCPGASISEAFADGQTNLIVSADDLGLAGDEAFGFSATLVDGGSAIAVGAPAAASNRGAVFLIDRGSGQLLDTWTGEGPGQYFGYALAAHPDGVLVGAPLAGGAGRAYLLSPSGTTLQTFDGPVAGSQFGAEVVAYDADLDNDGMNEVLVGAPGFGPDPGNPTLPGSAFLWGTAGQPLAQANGRSVAERYGDAIDVVGDLDADGRSEFVVGAPFALTQAGSGAGRVDLLTGHGVRMKSFDGTQAGARFGSSVSAGPDTNDDGLPDILIGEPLADTPNGTAAGSAYLFDTAGRLLAQFSGEATGDHLGRRVYLADDLNGDGLGDILLGSPLANDLGNTQFVFPSVDADGDGLDGAHDNCPAVSNADQSDVDTDGVGDVCDLCPLIADAGQPDQDSDGRGDACDCAPNDPGAFAAPDPVGGLNLSLSVNLESQLVWQPQGPTGGSNTVYDAVSGSLATLRAGGDFSDATCVAANVTAPAATTFQQTAPGEGHWYLVRAKNVCDTGTYDTGTSSQTVPRDPPILSAPATCSP